jgi:hypothetical protein
MRFVVKRADVQQVEDKQQAAAQVCNPAPCIIALAVTRALQLQARVQEQQLQLDEAERRHQLFVKRARFVTRPTAQAAACDVCLQRRAR